MGMRLYNLEDVIKYVNSLPEFEEKDIAVENEVSKNFKAIVYKGTKTIAAVVSNKYQLVQHKEVFNYAIEKIKSEFGENSIKGYVNSHRVKAYLFITFKDVSIQNDSDYRTGLLITNSVNGTLAIWTSLFLYRVICSNGLIEQQNLIQFQSKHLGTEELLNRFDNRLTTVIKNYDNYLKKEFDTLEQLKNIIAKPSEILKNLDLSRKAFYYINLKLKTNDTLFNIYQQITHYFSNNNSINITKRVEMIRKAKQLVLEYAKKVSNVGY
jgi:hypothetical protein